MVSRMKWSSLAPPLLAAALLAGCGTATGPRVKLNLFNDGPETIRDVELSQNGTVKYTLPTMPPNTGVSDKPGGDAIPAVSTIRYTREDGTRVERSIQPAETLASTFRGSVYYQINDDQVKAFYEPDRGDGVSSQPWNQPAAFENSFNLPGLGN